MSKHRIYFITIFIVNLFYFNSWAGSMEDIISKYIYIPKNAISKDLSGNTLDCFGKNRLYEEQVAFHFVSKNEVKYSYARMELNSQKDIIEILTLEDILKYKVIEDYILVENKRVANLSFNVWERGITSINREDLWLGDGMFSKEDSFKYYTPPQCKIVDIDTDDPFKKFDKYKIEEEEVKKEKKL